MKVLHPPLLFIALQNRYSLIHHALGIGLKSSLQVTLLFVVSLLLLVLPHTVLLHPLVATLCLYDTIVIIRVQRVQRVRWVTRVLVWWERWPRVVVYSRH